MREALTVLIPGYPKFSINAIVQFHSLPRKIRRIPAFHPSPETFPTKTAVKLVK
jgi:hypothetical protein